MASDADSMAVYQKLMEILDEQAVAALLSVSKDTMMEEERSRLAMLAQHFAVLNREDSEDVDSRSDDAGDATDQASDDASDGNARARNPRKRKRSCNNNPWRRVLKLEALSLHPAFEPYLGRSSTPDPLEFLSDGNVLTAEVLTKFTSEDLGDAFIACYKYTVRLETRHMQDRLRWCFVMLMYYDLVKLIRPQASGKRVGCLMREQVAQFLGQVAQTAFDVDVVHKQINEWNLIGRKLHQLCTKFSPGCLFYLADYLSRDFLLKLPVKGKYNPEAFAHLTRLGLKEKAAESKADELAHASRRRLIQVFEDAISRRSSPAEVERRAKESAGPDGLAANEGCDTTLCIETAVDRFTCQDTSIDSYKKRL